MSGPRDAMQDIGEDHPDYPKIIGRLNEGQCPDCGTQMLLGPRGGLSRNIFCETCGVGYNVAPWHFDKPPHNLFFVQRIRERR